jgi:hypothetical protein
MGLVEDVFARLERISFSNIFDEEGAAPAASFSPGVIFLSDLNGSMMDDIRFVGLCAKLGLCAYWDSTDCWPDCAAAVPYDFRAESRRLAEDRPI